MTFLEVRQARQAPELVAQSVGVLVLAAQDVEAGAAGGGEVDEHVGEGVDACYALRDARLDYLNGFDRTLASEEPSQDDANRAARARWGGRWEQKLEAARRRFDAT